MTFSSLGLSEPLLHAIAELGHETPTPVQSAAIPSILAGADVWASARTGSGKTAAFLLPILERLGRSPRETRTGTRALVIVPTRELAAQVGESAKRYAAHLPRALKTCVVVGGVSTNPQRIALRGGADLVVATPGRLLDLVASNALTLDAVETLVLDEADRLLALGFADELAQILARLPNERQNLFFSATFPPVVRELAEGILRAPVRIALDAGELPDAATIEQRAIQVDAGMRTRLLRHLLDAHGWTRALVFVASGYGADHVAGKLRRGGLAATSLHGDLSQGARTQALSDFNASRVRVLVATDVAARGIDVPELPAVVNYDLPRSAVDYLHRIGRTGRAGERGVAVSFVTADGEAHFGLIEKRHGIRIARERIEGFVPKDEAAPVLDAFGGVKGKRKSKKDKLREAAARAAREGGGGRNEGA